MGIAAEAIDPDASDTVSYSLPAGINDNDLFAIDSLSGEVTVNAALDAGTASSHTVTVTATSSDTSTSSADFTITVFSENPPADGDVNVDGVVDTADVLIATRIVTGIDSATQVQQQHMDVAPLVDGVPMSDGLLNAADLLLIQRKALGLVNF